MNHKQVLLEKYEKVFYKVCDMQKELEVLRDQSEGYPEHETLKQAYRSLSRIMITHVHPERLKIFNNITQYQVENLEKELDKVRQQVKEIGIFLT